MVPGSGIPYDPADLSHNIQTQLAGLGELAVYLTRSVTSGAIAGPSQVKPTSPQTLTMGEREEEEKMETVLRRVHLGDEWWADMTEQEILGYLERKETGKSGRASINIIRWLNM
jgi:hypothetical protein